MSTLTDLHAVRIRIAAAAAGALLWIIIAQQSGRREPWDSDIFWTAGMTGMLVLNAVLGTLLPRTVLLNAFCSVAAQPLVMMVMTGEIGSMFPLGCIVFAFLAVVYSIGGIAGRSIHHWYGTKRRKGTHAP